MNTQLKHYLKPAKEDECTAVALGEGFFLFSFLCVSSIRGTSWLTRQQSLVIFKDPQRWEYLTLSHQWWIFVKGNVSSLLSKLKQPFFEFSTINTMVYALR